MEHSYKQSVMATSLFNAYTDYWGTRLDTKLFYGMSGTILSFNVVHMDSVVIIVLLKSKQRSGRKN